MGFEFFIFLIFWGGVTVGSHACQPDEPPPASVIIAPAFSHDNPNRSEP